MMTGGPKSPHKHTSMYPMKLNVKIKIPDGGKWPSAHVGFQVRPELECAFWSFQSLRRLGYIDGNMEIIWKSDKGLLE